MIKILLNIHAKRNASILDVTHNAGVMWKGTELPVTRMDLAEGFPIDFRGDFGRLPIRDSSFDVIVFDPPHLPSAAASANSSKMWEVRYGIRHSETYGRLGDSVSGMFVPFLIEAKRVLVDDGIILAKIADITHNHRYQWQHIDFVVAAQATGLTACDLIVKADPSAGKLMSSKWANTLHVRKAHVYWIVVRRGGCEKGEK